MDFLIFIHKSLVEFGMNYRIIAWGGVSRTYLIDLEVTQEQFSKCVPKKNFEHPTDLLYEDSGIFDPRKLNFKNLAIV